jgi:hypothetical protein
MQGINLKLFEKEGNSRMLLVINVKYKGKTLSVIPSG